MSLDKKKQEGFPEYVELSKEEEKLENINAGSDDVIEGQKMHKEQVDMCKENSDFCGTEQAEDYGDRYLKEKQ